MNPFANLKNPIIEKDISIEMRTQWVAPFYMSLIHLSNEKSEIDFIESSKSINSKIVYDLLSDRDWRSRSVGAFFAAIKNYTELVNIIGTLLLKSERVYSGKSYCVALATFSDEKSRQFLTEYLKFYLTQLNSLYDQEEALAALYLIDKQEAQKFNYSWQEYLRNNPNCDLEGTKRDLANNLEMINRIRRQIN